MSLTLSYGNQKSNRTPHDVINLNQLDLETTDFRDETQLLNFKIKNKLKKNHTLN